MKKLRAYLAAIGTAGLLALLVSLGIDVATGQPIGSTTLALTPGSATVAPAIRATGQPANISINLVPKGTGTVQISGVPLTVSGGTFTSLNVNPGPLNVTGDLFVQPGTAATLKLVGAVIAHNITPTGNVGAGEDTVTTYSIPAGTFGADGESIELDLQGFNAANANAKRWRVRWGAATTVVLDSTSFGMNNTAVRIRCIVTRVTATSQNVACEGYQGGPITTGQAWNVGVGGGHSSQLLAEDMTLAQPITVTAEATANDDQVARSSFLKWYPVGQ